MASPPQFAGAERCPFGRKFSNGDRINGWLFHLLTNGGLMGVRNPLILTIDPNFLGHPSGGTATEGLKNPHVVGQD